MVIRIRTYGSSGSLTILIHGGPGAAGYLAPVANGLKDLFRVIEPFQRRSGARPLSVASHVADLHEIVISQCGGERPAVIGHSWGAMLALAYAGAHPEAAGPLVLIGCGTFDVTARGYMEATIEERTDDQLRLRLERLPEEISDPDERMREMGRLIQPIYSYELIRGAENDAEPESCDARGYEESWRDMIRLQEEGIYPRTFGEIKTPVLMLHGGFDPHPGQIIRASLEPHIPQLEYCEWERCGHSPWLEKHARDRFFEKLRQWLGERLRGAGERPSG